MLNNFRSALLGLGVFACLVVAPADAKQEPAVNKTETPGEQTLKIYQSLRDQDFKSLFYLLAFTPKGRAMLSTADQFAVDMKKGYDGGFKTPEEKAVSDNLLKSISNIMVGEPVVTDDKAVVPTSAEITISGKVYTFKGEAHLILHEGEWRLDLTFDENSEKAMEQRTTELFGKPVVNQ